MKNLKSFCESLKNVIEHKNIQNLLLSESEWTLLDVILSTLKPFASVTKRLQNATITLSDSYGMWLNIRLKMERQSRIDQFAKMLLTEMDSFRSVLIDVPIVKAALYLDPRYNILLDADDKEIAEDVLESLYNRINLTRPVTVCHENLEDECSLDEVSNFINRILHQNADLSTSRTIEQSETVNIKRILRDFKDKVQLSESVLVYWKQQQNLKPELYKLANIIFAIPPSQSSVERAFSAFALIFTPLRTQISDKVLAEILLIRLNKLI